MRLSTTLSTIFPLLGTAFARKCQSKGLSGPITHFDDNVYQCYEWNNRAKNAMKAGHLFAATNYKLASPNKGSMYKLNCNENYLCAKSKDGTEYTIIDWCDNKNCDFHEIGHIDVLVGLETKDGNTCVKGCRGYKDFESPWELVICKNQLNSKDFKKSKNPYATGGGVA